MSHDPSLMYNDGHALTFLECPCPLTKVSFCCTVFDVHVTS